MAVFIQSVPLVVLKDIFPAHEFGSTLSESHRRCFVYMFLLGARYSMRLPRVLNRTSDLSLTIVRFVDVAVIFKRTAFFNWRSSSLGVGHIFIRLGKLNADLVSIETLALNRRLSGLVWWNRARRLSLRRSPRTVVSLVHIYLRLFRYPN